MKKLLREYAMTAVGAVLFVLAVNWIIAPCYEYAD